MDNDAISINQALNLVNQLGDESTKKKLVDFISGLGLTGEATIKFGEITKGVGDIASNALHAIFQASMDLLKQFPMLATVAKEASESLDKLFQAATAGFDSLGIAGSDAIIFFEPLIGVIDKNITGMGRLGDTGLEAGAKITTAFKSIEPAMSAAFGKSKIAPFISEMAKGADRAISLERELLSMSVAQGRASDVFDKTTHKLNDLNDLYNQFAKTSLEAAIATNQSVGSIMELEKALSSIPGSLDAENTVKASRLAAATGKEQLEVAKELANMYTRLGTNEGDALDAMALINEKAGDSKLRMEAFNQTVMTVAGSFKMLGDNTVATTNFVNAFDKAFQDSKISPEAMREVITSIGTGIERMDVAKRAFVSGATGGPGGLAGAIQMDYAIQTGHVDEVIKKTMLAMQGQFGGQVVTLKDAAENPALAGELYKQVQYLTQVAGVAKDDKEAYRVLEAMKTGVMDMLKPGAGEGEKETALSRQIARGTEIQDQTKHGITGILMSALHMEEMMRLRQGQQSRTIMTGDADKFSQMTGFDIGDIFKKVGINISSIDRTQENDAAKHAGVSMLSHNKPGEPGPAAYAEPRWSEMIGRPLGMEGMLEGFDQGFDDFLSKVSERQTVKSSEEIRNHDAGRRMTYNPPPGTETGISHLIPGHKPTSIDLGLPEPQKLTLPSLLKENVGESKDLPPLIINHTFEPIQIDITGIGDQIISRTVDAKIKSEQARDIGQRGLGR